MSNPLWKAVNEKRWDQLLDLARNSKNIGIKDNYGRNILHITSLKSAPSGIIKELIDQGADVNALDNDYKTPLHYAVMTNKIEIIRTLLEHGKHIIKITAQDKNNQSPLSIALNNGNWKILELLIEKQPLTSTNGSIEDTALDRAILDKAWFAVDWLIQQTKKPVDDILKKSAQEKEWDVVMRYAPQKKIDHMDALTEKLVEQAALSEKWEVVFRLLTGNTTKTRITEPMDLIFAIATTKQWQLIPPLLTLLAKQADINQANYYGKSLLQLAIEKGQSNIATTLIQKGAHINFVDTEGRTPLDYALANRHWDIVKELIDHHAKIGTLDTHTMVNLLNEALVNPTTNGLSIVLFLLKNGANINDIKEETLITNKDTMGLINYIHSCKHESPTKAISIHAYEKAYTLAQALLTICTNYLDELNDYLKKSSDDKSQAILRENISTAQNMIRILREQDQAGQSKVQTVIEFKKEFQKYKEKLTYGGLPVLEIIKKKFLHFIEKKFSIFYKKLPLSPFFERSPEKTLIKDIKQGLAEVDNIRSAIKPKK